jgi:hypothetical protein
MRMAEGCESIPVQRSISFIHYSLAAEHRECGRYIFALMCVDDAGIAEFMAFYHGAGLIKGIVYIDLKGGVSMAYGFIRQFKPVREYAHHGIFRLFRYDCL